MKKRQYIDEETGWQVEDEYGRAEESWVPTIDRIVTNLETGEQIEQGAVLGHEGSVADLVRNSEERKLQRQQSEAKCRSRLTSRWPELESESDVPWGALGAIQLRFAEYFNGRHFLPVEAIEKRARGEISESSWLITFKFDEDSIGEYVEFFADSRFTNPRLVRIREDGSLEHIATPDTARLTSDDPIKDAELKAEFVAQHRQFNSLLRERGFIEEEPVPKTRGDQDHKSEKPKKSWWRFW